MDAVHTVRGEPRRQAAVRRSAEQLQPTDTPRKQQHRHGAGEAGPATVTADWFGEWAGREEEGSWMKSLVHWTLP